MRSVLWRIALSLGVGVVIFGVTFLSAWISWGAGSTYYFGRHAARAELETLRAALLAYREAHGVFPASLKELCESEEGNENVARMLTAEGVVQDFWDHPYVYERGDSGFDLYSLGRDGEPGGVGVDTDIHADGRGFAQSVVTLGQFIDGALAPKALQVSAWSALASAALAAWMARKPPPGRTKREHVARLVVTAIGACVVLWHLVVLDTPTGH